MKFKLLRIISKLQIRHVTSNPLLLVALLVLTFATVLATHKIHAAPPVQPTGQFTLEDVDSTGAVASTGAEGVSVSKDGRYILFESSAPNLGYTPPPNTKNLFLRDRQTGSVELVSILPDGTEENLRFDHPSSAHLSSNAQFVAFHSDDGSQTFLRDLVNQTTVQLPLSSGLQYMTPDARYFVYRVRNNNIFNLWLFDWQLETHEALTVNSSGTESDSSSSAPVGMLSDDGRYFVFDSNATNLVPNHPTTQRDIYIRDRLNGTTSLIYQNVTPNCGSRNAKISGDARFVAFVSCASNLVSGDTNNREDIFLLDRQNDSIIRVNLSPSGNQATDLTGLEDLTDDGRYVVFAAQEPDFNPYNTTGQTAYIRDTLLGITELIGQNPNCKQVAHGAADGINVITNDGRYVLFNTDVDKIVLEDTNGFQDIYLRDRAVPFGKLAKNCR